MSGHMIVARVGSTRWDWWPGLQRIDLLQKGAHRPTHTLYLSERQNTEAGALRAILAHETRDRA